MKTFTVTCNNGKSKVIFTDKINIIYKNEETISINNKNYIKIGIDKNSYFFLSVPEANKDNKKEIIHPGLRGENLFGPKL